MAPLDWPFGAYPIGGLEALGPHVTAYYADGYPLSNSAIVRGTDATLVFDANVLRYALALRAAVDAMVRPPLSHLVLSHTHNDHAHGAMRFAPPARTWARSWTRQRLEYWAGMSLQPFADEFASHYPTAPEEYRDVRIVIPDRVVDEQHTIDLGGGVRVQLYPEVTAHTPGDLWALIEPDGVALCGDLWFNQCEPYLGHRSIGGSLTALTHLREADAKTYLPGHGPAGQLLPQGRDMMERYCTWLDRCIDAEWANGQTGVGLRSICRVRFEEQQRGIDPIYFAYTWPDALEDAVEAAEKALLQTEVVP